MSELADRPRAIWLNRQTPPHIATLVLVAGLSALNMNIFLPSLPSMAEYFHTDYSLVQLAVSAYLGVTAVLQLLIGPLSDRFGRRKVILLSCLGLGLDYIFMAVAPSLAWLFVGRMISGITAASFSTAAAYIAFP